MLLAGNAGTDPFVVPKFFQDGILVSIVFTFVLSNFALPRIIKNQDEEQLAEAEAVHQSLGCLVASCLGNCWIKLWF